MQFKTNKMALAFFLFILSLGPINAQTDTLEMAFYQPPIPLEVMVGEKSSMYELVVSKQIMKSRFKFNSLINFEVVYKTETDIVTPDIYYVQNIISYDLSKGFGIGVGGNFQTYNPFKPLVAVSYGYFTENIGFVFQPSYELHEDGAFELYSLFEWVGNNSKKLQPYIKVSGYSSFKKELTYSYHNWRIGANYRSFRFGPAMNAQYFGDYPGSYNFGGFVNVLIN